MAVVPDPQQVLETLRAWAAEMPDQPIIAIYFQATTTTPAEWAFQQGDRANYLTLPEETTALLQSRGLLEIRRSAIDGTWRIHLR